MIRNKIIQERQKKIIQESQQKIIRGLGELDIQDSQLRACCGDHENFSYFTGTPFLDFWESL